MTYAVFRATLRLTLRSVWFWAMALLSLGLVILFGLEPSGVAGMANMLHREVSPFLLFFLGQMLAVVTEARRERSERAQELFDALPCRPAAWVLGRAGALYLVWLAAATLLWLVAVVEVVLLRRQPVVPFLFWDWLLTVPLTLVFTTGVAFGIGFFIRRGFAAYALILLICVGGSIFGLQMITSLSGAVMGGGPAKLFDFSLSIYFPLTQWPVFPDAWPLVYNRLHVVGVGALWIGLAAWTLARRRKDPGRWAAVAWAGALAVILFAFAASRSVWAPRLQMLDRERAAYYPWSRAARANVPPQLPAPVVRSYAVRLTPQPAMPGLTAEAELDVSAPGEWALFTLNRLFTVEQITGPDGAAVPYTRDGDLLTLATGGRSGLYRIAYQGYVAQWRQDAYEGLRLGAHVAKNSVMLPAALGWYPLPGRQALAVPDPHGYGAVDGHVSHPPVAFHLEIAGGPDLHFISNADDGRPVNAAWLIGTEYPPVMAGGATYYVSPMNRKAPAAMADRVGAELAFLESLVPLDRPLRVIEFPDALWYGRDLWVPADQFDGALLVPATAIGRVSYTGSVMTSPWWQGGRTAEETQVRQVLTLFMLDLYNRTHPSAPVDTLVRTPFDAFGPSTEPGRQLLTDLLKVWSERGPEATGHLLRSLYAAPAPVGWNQAAAAVQKGAIE